MPAENRPSAGKAALARKRKKLLAQARKAVAKAQASAQAESSVDLGPAATKLRAEIAALRREVEATPGADAQAAASALADYEKCLAGIVAAARASSDPAQAMAALQTGYLALVDGEHAARKAGHGWAL